MVQFDLVQQIRYSVALIYTFVRQPGIKKLDVVLHDLFLHVEHLRLAPMIALILLDELVLHRLGVSHHYYFAMCKISHFCVREVAFSIVNHDQKL